MSMSVVVAVAARLVDMVVLMIMTMIVAVATWWM